jgi:membrane-anchored protein YejM (alkaline phosphatase superfamily)
MELDFAQELNREELRRTGHDAALEGRIESFELAFRMQAEAPDLQDVNGESEATKKLYGLDKPVTEDFGRQCLMARRLSEKGVRFVQVSHTYKWDQHSELLRDHAQNAKEVDQPIAGLLADLKARGLLKDTLVVWGGEFGRTPTAEGSDGRDHNPEAFTYFLAGGGVKSGLEWGATDDYGYYSVENKVHFHDLHATILYLLGLDHKRLTYRYAGRDFRLTDVHGEVVNGIVA